MSSSMLLEEGRSNKEGKADEGQDSQWHSAEKVQPMQGASWIKTPEQLKNILLIAYVPEYLSLPIFYQLGISSNQPLGLAGQFGFLAFSCGVQYRIFKSGSSDDCGMPLLKEAWLRNDIVDAKLPCNLDCGLLKRCGMRQWHVDLLSMTPNYAHVPSTALAVGGAWNSWPQTATAFARHWSDVPIIGEAVGQMGAPWILTGALIFSAGSHGISALLAYKFSNDGVEGFTGQSDAANFLFITKVLLRSNKDFEELLGGVGYIRMLLGVLVKVPMIWMKTSMFALSFDSMSLIEIISMIVAISLAWYSFAPLCFNILRLAGVAIYGFCLEMIGGEDLKESAMYCAVMLALMLLSIFVVFSVATLLSHFFGVFLCRETHDFSIFHGCSDF